MTENGLDVSGEYSRVVTSFTKRECYHHALRAIKTMRELGYEQGQAPCATALRAAKRLNRHDDVLAIGSYYDPVASKTDNATARGNKRLLAVSPDNADLARAVLRDIQDEDGATLTNNTASTIATALLKDGSMRESVEVLEYAQKKGVHLDPKIFAPTLKAVSQARQYELVLRVWDAMRAQEGFKRWPWMYTLALVAAGHLRLKERVFEILDEAKNNQVRYAKMYEHALGAACQTKQHELVCGILEYMHASGVDSSIGYRNTIRLAFKFGEYDFSFELLRRMEEHGIDPTEAYTHQIMSLDKAGLHRQVLDAFEDMQKAGCICDEDIYGAVVASAVQMQDRELVFSMLDEITSRRNANLSKARSVVFPRAVTAAIYTSQHRLVLDIFDFLDQAGVDASATYISAYRTAFKSEQYDSVFDILRRMTENGVDAREAYTNAVMSFSKLECYHHALRAFKTMRDLGYKQKETLCTTALRAAVKLNRHDDVVAISNGLGGKDPTPSRVDSYALEHAHAMNNQALVDSILNKIKKSTSAATWSAE